MVGRPNPQCPGVLLRLQWGPTRGPGWSGGGRRPHGGEPVRASVGPDPRAGMVAVDLDQVGLRPTLASVGPDPRAGMVASSRARTRSGPSGFSGARPEGRDGRRSRWVHGRDPVRASVGPDPRAGMVDDTTTALTHPPWASVGPDPRAGMVASRAGDDEDAAEGFSGARPEGRDGRQDGTGLSRGRVGLQWGPTRGPGWSPTTGLGCPGPSSCFSGARPEGRDGRRWGRRYRRHDHRFSGARPEGRDGRAPGIRPDLERRGASVGPDPRAGMVGCSVWWVRCADARPLQWGPTRGPGWSCPSGPHGRCVDRSFSGARPEGRDGRPSGRIRDPLTFALQWGPTRGPGWSRCEDRARGHAIHASVGPDPRAGMVASGGSGGSFTTAGFSGARPEGRDGRSRHAARCAPLPVASVGPDPRAGMVG